MTYSIKTDFPVAHDSPDHTHPFGAVRDNNTSQDLVDEIFNSGVRSALDIGCAGGAFVRSLAEAEIDAVGVEGSSRPAERGWGEWPLLKGHRLFTADATRPFAILRDGEPAKFDLITSWECLEHLNYGRLPEFFSNVRAHLGGLFVGSITPNGHKPHGVELHQTQMPLAEWEKMFNANRLHVVPYPLKHQLRPDCHNFLIAARPA